jgi:hypothetical protein
MGMLVNNRTVFTSTAKFYQWSSAVESRRSFPTFQRCLLPPSSGCTEAVSSSKMSVNIYQTTRRKNPEDSHLHTCRRENLKSHLDHNLHVHTCCMLLSKQLRLLINYRIFALHSLVRRGLFHPRTLYCNERYSAVELDWGLAFAWTPPPRRSLDKLQNQVSMPFSNFTGEGWRGSQLACECIPNVSGWRAKRKVDKILNASSHFEFCKVESELLGLITTGTCRRMNNENRTELYMTPPLTTMII